jgi:Fic family protein
VAFDWDKLNIILAPELKIPVDSITTVEYAKRNNITRQHAYSSLSRLVEQGIMTSVKVKHERYFTFIK